MFAYNDVAAFVLRLAIFLLIFSTYPLLSFFLNDMIMKLFFRNVDVNNTTSFLINFGISFFPLLFALFYPNVGIILSYAGAVSGFAIIYILPVTTYMKWRRTQIQNPLLAEALKMNEYNVAPKEEYEGAPLSPKINVSDNIINRHRRSGGLTKSKQAEKAAMKSYYISYALHMTIPIYGLFVLVF